MIYFMLKFIKISLKNFGSKAEEEVKRSVTIKNGRNDNSDLDSDSHLNLRYV